MKNNWPLWLLWCSLVFRWVELLWCSLVFRWVELCWAGRCWYWCPCAQPPSTQGAGLALRSIHFHRFNAPTTQGKTTLLALPQAVGLRPLDARRYGLRLCSNSRLARCHHLGHFGQELALNMVRSYVS